MLKFQLKLLDSKSDTLFYLSNDVMIQHNT